MFESLRFYGNCIPINQNKINSLYEHIRPIIKRNDTLYLLEPVHERMLNIKSFIQPCMLFAKTYSDDELKQMQILNNGLKLVETVNILSSYIYFTDIKPTVSEILMQFPKKYQDKNCFFRVIEEEKDIKRLYKTKKYHVITVEIYLDEQNV